MMIATIEEWGFPEGDENVNIERLYVELGSLPGIYAFSYIDKLERLSPSVYQRLKEYARPKGLMRWHVWDDERAKWSTA